MSQDWLRGGVMAYRKAAMSEESFLDDLFALDHIRCGLGEDTILSRRIGSKGELIMVLDAEFHHPHDDQPRTYPIDAFRLGYARAYSRRLLNDQYRVFGKPSWHDRLNLLTSYLGNILILFWSVLEQHQRYRMNYALGYTKGAIRGILVKPSAKNLTPNIHWREDARNAGNDLKYI